jgi:hypothetical protein
MNKPKAIKQRPIIKAQIVIFFDQFRPGDVLRSEEICRYVKVHMSKKYLYEGTILRYLRELREDGIVNYTCTNKQLRYFKILRPEEPHSL